jgi:hypothetical protein
MSIYTKCGTNENSDQKMRKKIQESGYFKILESRGRPQKTEASPKKQEPSN